MPYVSRLHVKEKQAKDHFSYKLGYSHLSTTRSKTTYYELEAARIAEMKEAHGKKFKFHSNGSRDTSYWRMD